MRALIIALCLLATPALADVAASDALAAVIVGKPSAFVVFSKYLSMFLRGSDSSPAGKFWCYPAAALARSI